MCSEPAISLRKLSKVAFQSPASLPLMPIIFIKVLDHIHLLETLVANLNLGPEGEFMDYFLYGSAEYTTEDEAV